MTPLEIMEAVYETITQNMPSALKKLYGPGRPAGPFAQNLPAAVILTGRPALRREAINEDLVRVIYRIEVHLFTIDPLARAEERVRGTYGQLYPLLSDLANILWNNRFLDGRVTELSSMEIFDNGPGHGWIDVEYMSVESNSQ